MVNKKTIKPPKASSALKRIKSKTGFLVDTTSKYPTQPSPRQKKYLEKRKRRNRYA